MLNCSPQPTFQNDRIRVARPRKRKQLGQTNLRVIVVSTRLEYRTWHLQNGVYFIYEFSYG